MSSPTNQLGSSPSAPDAWGPPASSATIIPNLAPPTGAVPAQPRHAQQPSSPQGKFLAPLAAMFGRRRRGWMFAGYAALALTVVGGSTVWAMNDTTASIVVDGQEQQVRFFGRGVDTALEAADVKVGPGDVVVPGLDDTVRDGSQILVTHARDIQLVVDGNETSHRVAASTVGEALEILDVRVETATLSVSRSAPIGREGIRLVISHTKPFTVTVAGEARQLEAAGNTVGEALQASGITVGPLDEVTPPVDTALTDNLAITVVKVERTEKTIVEEIPFKTTTKKTGDLDKGVKKVEVKGVKGQRELRKAFITRDGQPAGEEVVSSKELKAPVQEVVLVGTRPVAAPETPAPEPAKPGDQPNTSPAVPAGSVWDKLAECESGGNWKINTGNGYYGGLQFSARSWRAVGGTGLPHQHSRETQIEMGKRLKAKQGWGAWPACSRKLGLR